MPGEVGQLPLGAELEERIEEVAQRGVAGLADEFCPYPTQCSRKFRISPPSHPVRIPAGKPGLPRLMRAFLAGVILRDAIQ